MFASLVSWTHFTCCCPLSWLPIWRWSRVVDPCFIHCYIETVANNALNHRHVVFDQLWVNAAPTLNTAFSLTNVHAKWWIHCLLISSTHLLSHTTSIYNRPKWVCGVFWDNCRIRVTWVFSVICVCPSRLKSAYHLLIIVSDRAESE